MLGGNEKEASQSGSEVSTHDPGGVQTTVKLPGIIDNRIFSLINTGKTKNGVTSISANCLLCKGGKTLQGDTNSSGNFLKHLRTVHPTQHDEYQKRKRQPTTDKNQPLMKKLCTVLSVTSGKTKRADHYVMTYIVNDMRPLSTVSSPAFRYMIRGLCQSPDMEIMCRKTLQLRINTYYDEIVSELSFKLKSKDYVCITADCWSSHVTRAFLGVTCHWINKDFSRESRVLACTRFKGIHSYDRIAEKLISVMKIYGIQKEQVVSIVTDNGSNFCKAFKEFGIEFDSATSQAETENGIEIDFDVSEAETEDDLSIEDLIEIDLHSVMEKEERISLPPHVRCTSHSLSLVATKDGLDVKDKRLYNTAIGKCTKLWNLSSSPKSAEKIKNVCGKSLKRPVPTRWNSLYDSLERLLSMEPHLDALCNELGVPKFQTKDQFLKEFMKFSRPVALALDKLKGEFGVYMGSLVPTLIRVKAMITEVKEDTECCSKGYATAYLNGIEKRFGKIMTIDEKNPSDYILAALTNPMFKFRWVDQDLHSELKKQFVLKATMFAKKSLLNNSPLSEVDEIDPFYDFGSTTTAAKSNEKTKTVNNVELECFRYFNDQSTKLSMLSQYPTVEKMFRRYNTSLPSSAPVERVFSYAGMILSPKRTNLTDSNFEKIVFLKCNNIFSLS